MDADLTFSASDREPGVMTPEEVAVRLRVSKSTVRRWVRDGDMKCCHVGRIMRITQAQLDAFLDEDHGRS